ncbi:hypothetical protein ACK389_00215 [Streptomyces antibioticus]|uniref:Uncharacterized protein n=1 Tax=Streptomyces antibioticus TaxID=1890 RepID=A0AAE6YFN6_STRAT|nr:hypothetical protein [Streptomyces antibioticus]MCX4740932.1 hypothetical protein [Streptomyces antibioticus]MCX5173663.1 hypothetical protein [Streptomyces antibioticus]QIT48567.1 hypothetical protein HCX60_37800 [Streptomyces antibioticus]
MPREPGDLLVDGSWKPKTPVVPAMRSARTALGTAARGRPAQDGLGDGLAMLLADPDEH